MINLNDHHVFVLCVKTRIGLLAQKYCTKSQIRSGLSKILVLAEMTLFLFLS